MSNKYLRVIIVFIFIFPLFFSSASDIKAQEFQTVTLTSAKDSMIVEDDSANYGSSSKLSVGNEGEYKSFLVAFDLSVIPSNAAVDSANLTLIQTISEGSDITLNAYRVTSSWMESTVSGTDKPEFDAGFVYGAMTVDSNLGEKSFNQDLSDLVQNWVSDSSSNYGFYFESVSESSFLHEFGSKEMSGSNPSLIVSYTLPDEDPPVITGITVSDVTVSSVKISWQTDEKTTSFVDYGGTESYGMVSGNDDLSTDHVVEIGLLEADTTYHFKVRCKDESGNQAESNDMTFVTIEDGDDETKDQSDKSDETVSEEIDPPKNLKLNSGGEDDSYFVELNWDHSTEEDYDGYRIFRSKDDNTSYILLTEVGREKTYYKDSDIEDGVKYYYVIRTVKEGSESNDSNEESIIVYKNRLEEEIHKLNFWRGFLILNIILFVIFGIWFLIFKKKIHKRKKNLKLFGKKNKIFKKKKV